LLHFQIKLILNVHKDEKLSHMKHYLFNYQRNKYSKLESKLIIDIFFFVIFCNLYLFLLYLFKIYLISKYGNGPLLALIVENVLVKIAKTSPLTTGTI